MHDKQLPAETGYMILLCAMILCRKRNRVDSLAGNLDGSRGRKQEIADSLGISRI